MKWRELPGEWPSGILRRKAWLSDPQRWLVAPSERPGSSHYRLLDLLQQPETPECLIGMYYSAEDAKAAAKYLEEGSG